jgi:hypothetical protein
MSTVTELGVTVPARASILHPEHPLHHLVLDLVEQVDQTFEQWMAKVAPSARSWIGHAVEDPILLPE